MSHYNPVASKDINDGGYVVAGTELPDTTYTTVANAINALDDVYRSVRAELSLLAEKGTK
ncbi:hypothetical protein SEABISCUIT_55 [Mycobacterium phage Seabiscuit]|uniref:hypothetical protein n=1 Tax=Mycobacterium phage Seabiscuit TaxID=1458714 RepID=UPI00043AC182|nr:hypothetical protein SEABISCUIT_55 [Mycobacterium phage Seabiscuit]AHN84373.1 hypothetical protein SEABISCUIT_55 [Mycobacterium phage Seabiscuit]AVO25661.1 hypothetical protein SEA_MCGUIRE_54 [Mycobacterium phage McGuire]WAB08917.1 hypothetical protein PBI_TOTE_48 [Mycobacterium phage Tote]WNM68081.1 hypothetical protein SEA_JULIACHILD_53 [Mycobacterium phage JuliaChild]